MRYHLILPPGWVLLPVRDEAGKAIKDHVESLFDPGQRDRTAHARRALRTSLEEIASSARESGGVDLIMPLSMPWPMPLSASIVTSQHPTSPDISVGDAFETGAGIARRELQDVTAAEEANQGPAPDDTSAPVVPLRRVTYQWAVPDRAETFLASMAVSGQDLPEHRPLVDAITTLVDTIMSTLTWDRDS